MFFKYGMRCRPFSIGTFPKEGFYHVEHLTDAHDRSLRERYHDILIYERELADDEIYDYELDFIGECDDEEKENADL